MDINELIKRRLLKEVKVKRPSDGVVAAGNRESIMIFQNPMSGLCCAGNSQCIVEAMKAKDERNWHIVQGFAIPKGESKPQAHVWVRKGSHHYDPTWTRFTWWSENLKYYRLTRPLAFGPSERMTLDRLKDLAMKCKLDLLGGM